LSQLFLAERISIVIARSFYRIYTFDLAIAVSRYDFALNQSLMDQAKPIGLIKPNNSICTLNSIAFSTPCP